MEDPQAVADALQMLFEAETEFFIKVEGTATLPYASRVQLFDLPEDQLVLKLVRPLPHEMPAGALFTMTFTVDDLRFEASIELLGRFGYLQYSFRPPTSLFQADRRRHKRYPFRPRENAYVIAQNAAIPGLGVAGPLVNVSQGGMALRVDRALRMDDGVRVPVSTALFERGKGFPRFRLQDLPLLRLLEGRALCAHCTEHGTELVLGLSFTGMGLEEEAALARSLEFREKMYRGGQRPEGEPARPGQPQAEGEEPEPEPESRAQEVTALLRLRRRAARVVLVMADGPVRAGIQDRLRQHGYHRTETIEHMGLLRPLCEPGQRQALPAMVLADLALARTGDAEPLAAARILENQMLELGGLATIILCEEVDPTLLLAQGARTRFLPYPDERGDRWVETLDGMLG
ncbi:MAG: PilZ domain-containing protein [Holophaga sp.]|nr:PilZ domain-containing protein [Holophaga sp.]